MCILNLIYTVNGVLALYMILCYTKPCCDNIQVHFTRMGLPAIIHQTTSNFECHPPPPLLLHTMSTDVSNIWYILLLLCYHAFAALSYRTNRTSDVFFIDWNKGTRNGKRSCAICYIRRKPCFSFTSGIPYRLASTCRKLQKYFACKYM